MKTRFLLSLVCVLGSASMSLALSLKPDTSVKCVAPDASAEVKNFSFDLYATGFPMGGVAMFSGMFEAEAQLDCRTLRGHIYTTYVNKHLEQKATSECLDTYEFVLDVPTDLYKVGVTYNSTLSYRQMGPFEPPTYKTVAMNCQLSN